MQKNGSKLIPIILVIIVTLVAIFALVSIGRALLNRNKTPEVAEDSPAKRSLLTTEADRSVKMTVRGPIIADEEFHTYEIEVSPTSRQMTTKKGYQGEAIDTVRLGNSTEAYDEFVHALSKANFTGEEGTPDDFQDMRGTCATGRLYKFEILQAQSVEKQLWVSNCRDVPASFKGNAVLVRDLFLKQIPDSNRLIRNLNI